jgi:hypothetical protein
MPATRPPPGTPETSPEHASSIINGRWMRSGPRSKESARLREGGTRRSARSAAGQKQPPQERKCHIAEGRSRDVAPREVSGARNPFTWVKTPEVASHYPCRTARFHARC